MFFARECRNVAMPAKLRANLDHFACKNVVSHVTAAVPRHSMRPTIYGRKPRLDIKRTRGMAAHALMKHGVQCNHHRVNTSPVSACHGKFLVFKSSNMIRAGKFTHAMAMSKTVLFCRWIRKIAQTRFQWHTAMSAPNMVVSGKLKTALPDHVKHHWRATHTSKFPGIAIATDGPCTPELYKSGAFIIPGITCVASLEKALEAMDEAINGHPAATSARTPPPAQNDAQPRAVKPCP